MKNVLGQTLNSLFTKRGVKYWEQLLATMKMNINSSLDLITEYTPFLLNYGFHPVALTELLSGDEISTVKYVQNSVCSCKTLCKTAKANLQKFVVKQLRLYNKKYRTVEFEVRDRIPNIINRGSQITENFHHLLITYATEAKRMHCVADNLATTSDIWERQVEACGSGVPRNSGN